MRRVGFKLHGRVCKGYNPQAVIGNTSSPSVFWLCAPTHAKSPAMIPFIDLHAQRQRLGQPLEDAILKVVRSGAYVMGPEIAELEAALCAFGQAPHALTCGSGTEALILP